MSVEDRAGAWRLLGMTTDSGWTIVEPVGWDPKSGDSIDHYNGTGGNFSVPYIVEKDGGRAFFKAIDLTRAMNSPDILGSLRFISEAHAFETEILRLCAGASMSRVVVALESGQLRAGPNLQDAAPFLVFELAEGDVRRRVQKKSGEVRLAWWLRAMHHATVGLAQLHSLDIAHQDLKPSNLLSFEGDEVFKLSDLGRCTSPHVAAPHEALPFSGDPKYAPPEILYGYINPQVQERRLRTDLWMLGSMIFFFVQGLGATQLLFNELDADLKPLPTGTWNGGYRPIVPTLQTCFTKMLYDLENELPDNHIQKELVKAASELCNPDDSLRGHPLARSGTGSPQSLERYVSLFDRLARLAALRVT